MNLDIDLLITANGIKWIRLWLIIIIIRKHGLLFFILSPFLALLRIFKWNDISLPNLGYLRQNRLRSVGLIQGLFWKLGHPLKLLMCPFDNYLFCLLNSYTLNRRMMVALGNLLLFGGSCLCIRSLGRIALWHCLILVAFDIQFLVGRISTVGAAY